VATYWLMLMVFVPSVSPSITHVGNFSTPESCAQAAIETATNISALAGPGPIPNATYRMLCVRSSDGKTPN